jgi:hypothetical protein
VRIGGYSGLARIVQPGGVEVLFACRYEVEEAPYDGPISWRGNFAELDGGDDVGGRLDPHVGAQLVLPDGRRGSILIDTYNCGIDYAGRTERGTFVGIGPYPGQAT